MVKRTVVITGCSSGFGRCTALELVRRGWHVFGTVRKDEDRAELLAEVAAAGYAEQLTLFLCDITQSEQVANFAREVAASLRQEQEVSLADSIAPPLNAIINNAGTAYGGPIEILPLNDLRAQLEINVIAHVGVIQAFLPMLKAAHGTIINVSSISGKFTTPTMGPYSASKYALEAISDTLRLEVAHFGVHVVLIEPGSSPTGIWKTSLQRSMSSIGDQKEESVYAPLLRTVEKVATRSSRTGFPTQLFADTVVRILESPHPRARYGVPFSASLLLFARRFLPDRLLDSLIRLIMHW